MIGWVITGALSLAAFYIGNRWAYLFMTGTQDPLQAALTATNTLMTAIAEQPLKIYLQQECLVGGALLALAFLLFTLNQSMNRKHFRKGEEYGSARWGTPRDIKPFIDPEPSRNMILTETESITLNGRMKNPEHNRNKNVLVVGGAGSGKTRFYVKPNLMQMHSSYVVTDPKGTILDEVGQLLAENGYKIKVFNLYEMSKSNHYNPFVYIRKEEDVLTLIENLVVNTTPPEQKGGDPFFSQAEKALLQALMFYIFYEAPAHEQNFETLLQLLLAAEVREDDEAFQSPLDILFAELAEKDSSHIAVQQYRIFKMAAGKTAKSILISAGVRLAPFTIKAVRELLSEDDIALDTLGEEKAVLFIIIPDSNKTFNFLAAMMYTQLFQTLMYKADMVYGGRLPIHVRLLIDEFANIGKIPNFEEIISTIRSREISATVVLQNLAQLKAKYDKSWETITGNCDTMLFLGGKEQSTLEYMSKELGKATIDNQHFNKTVGREKSRSEQNQNLGRELLTPDEIGVMSGSKCILTIRGVRPFFSKKFDITKHRHYKRLADYDKTNLFNIEKYRERESEQAIDLANCDIYNIDLSAEM